MMELVVIAKILQAALHGILAPPTSLTSKKQILILK